MGYRIDEIGLPVPDPEPPKPYVYAREPKNFGIYFFVIFTAVCIQAAVTVSYLAGTFLNYTTPFTGITRKPTDFSTRVDNIIRWWEGPIADKSVPTTDTEHNLQLRRQRHQDAKTWLLADLSYADTYNKWLSFDEDQINDLDIVELTYFLGANNNEILNTFSQNLSTPCLKAFVIKIDHYFKAIDRSLELDQEIANADKDSGLYFLLKDQKAKGEESNKSIQLKKEIFVRELNNRPQISLDQEKESGNLRHQKAQTPSAKRKKEESKFKAGTGITSVTVQKGFDDAVPIKLAVKPRDQSYINEATARKSKNGSRQIQ